MGVWLGPRGASELVIDLSSFTGKGCAWDTDTTAEAPTVTNDGWLRVYLKKVYDYGSDPAGIAVSGPIDLTKYNTITAVIASNTGYSRTRLYVSQSNTAFDKNSDLNVTRDNGATADAVLDVSSLTGTYYFGVAIESTTAGGNEAIITISSIKATK
jgi:hypothetical protein